MFVQISMRRTSMAGQVPQGEKREEEEFISLHDLLMSIDKHLSSIESSVTVIRRTAEDTNARIKERRKVRPAHGKVS